MARYVEALERYRGGRLNCMEATEPLGSASGISDSCATRCEAEGLRAGSIGGGGGLRGPRAPVERIEYEAERFRTRYRNFLVKHFQHFYEALQSAAHCKKRPCRPLPV